MNRRQFHQRVAATAAAIALGGKPLQGAPAAPASVPLDPLPAGAAARLGCGRLWHLWPASNPGLNDLTFSPDGRYLATLGYQDDHVCIWSIPDGQAVRDWGPQDVDRGGSLLWTEQGLYVSSNGGLTLWEPMTASLIHRFSDEAMRGLAASAEGQWIAAAAFGNGWVEVWDAHTRQPVARLNADPERKPGRPFDLKILLSVAFSQCGRWLAVGGYPHSQTGHLAGFVHCWDLAARRHLVRYLTNGGPVGQLAFTPTGQLLTADWAGTVALWEPLQGRLLRDWPRRPTGCVFRSLAVNASGQIAFQHEDGVWLWHAEESSANLLCPARGYYQLAYSGDGRFLAGGLGSGRVDLYDAATGADLSPPDRHWTHVGAIELTADGTVCLVCLGYCSRQHPAAELALRDMRTGVRLGARPPEGWQPLALAPVGTRIAGLLNASRLAVWDWSSGDVTTHPELDPQRVAWHPDGQALVAIGKNGEVVSWQPGTGMSKRQAVAWSVPVLGLAVAADCAAALCDKGDLFVWRLDGDDAPQRLARLPQPGSFDCGWGKCQLALSPDGLSVAVSYGDGVVHAGPVANGELRPIYTHPAGDEDSEDGHSIILRYTPAGRLLIAGACSTVRDGHWWHANVVTDGQSGEVVLRSAPAPRWATATALSPDGQKLLTGHEDGTLLVWPIGGES
jgi:WD40 repeat protein